MIGGGGLSKDSPPPLNSTGGRQMSGVQLATFRVAGRDIAENARLRVLSEDWMGGIEYLMESLGGINFHEATSILSGENTLVDVPEGMDLAPENPEIQKEYQEEFNLIYAGRIKKAWRGETSWWVPVAVVSNIGPRDQDWRVITVGDKSLFLVRLRHYIEVDECIKVLNTRRILDRELHVPCSSGMAYAFVFRKCSDPPMWLDRHRDPVDAVIAWLEAGGVLEERGHIQWYGEPKEPVKEMERASPGPQDPVPAHLFKGTDEARAKARQKIQREEELKREQKHKDLLKRTKEAITQRADAMEDGWLDLEVKPLEESAITDADRKKHPEWLTMESYRIRVARVPFEHWTLRAFPHEMVSKLLTPWDPLSPESLKLYEDDQYHSDWMLSADRDLFQDYASPIRDEPLQNAIFDAMNAIQTKYCNTQGVVLSSFGGYKTGIAAHPGPGEDVKRGEIAIIPAASVDYDRALRSANAIITERGGPLAHVAIVAREEGRTVLQVPGAREKYPVGAHLAVDPANGTVEVLRNKLPELPN